MFKKFLPALLLIAAFSASAQSGFDSYDVPRTAVLAPPSTISGYTAAGAVTNQPIDVRLYNGIGKIDIFGLTNTYGSTMTATLQSSPDTTNWTSVGSISVASATSVTYSNFYYGGSGFAATNTWLLPGTFTTPTAATAGWATTYLAPAPFTNSGAITVSSGNYAFGVNIDDCQRYLRLVWTPGGTVTNWTGSAIITGRTHGEVKY